MSLWRHLWWKRVYFNVRKNITQNDVENKQLKEENEKLRKENENKKVETRNEKLETRSQKLEMRN